MNWTPYVGLPFGEGQGQVTCWALVRRVLREQRGIDLPEYGEISAQDMAAVARAMRDGQESEWADPWQPVSVPQAFDVALMRVPSGRHIAHVGIMTGPRTLLHVEAATDSVLVSSNHFSVRGRIVGFRRHLHLDGC